MSWDSQRFSSSAKTWNSLPGKKDEAKKFIDEIRSNCKLNKTMRVLDFGCGTGLNGLGFVNDVQTVAFLDTSDGMLEQVEISLRSIGATNYEIYSKDITEIKEIQPFDIIMTTLSFHHIEDIDSTVKRFSELTRKGGKVFVVDLYTEDGSFHGSVKVPHNGFDPEDLKKTFLNFGFKNITHKNFGTSYGYPIFILIAEK